MRTMRIAGLMGLALALLPTATGCEGYQCWSNCGDPSNGIPPSTTQSIYVTAANQADAVSSCEEQSNCPPNLPILADCTCYESSKLKLPDGTILLP